MDARTHAGEWEAKPNACRDHLSDHSEYSVLMGEDRWVFACYFSDDIRYWPRIDLHSINAAGSFTAADQLLSPGVGSMLLYTHTCVVM